MSETATRPFQMKDLITCALMVVCAYVIYFLCALLSFTPYTMVLVCPLWAVLAAITFFLVGVRTRSPRMLFVLMAAVSLSGLYLPNMACGLIAAIACLLLTRARGAADLRALTASWMLYAVATAFGGMYVPFLFFSQQTIASYGSMHGEAYLETLTTMSTPWFVAVMLCVTAICAFIGSLVARKLLKKHFEKTGVV